MPTIAQRIYEERTFADLLILADALEEAGFTEAELLAHCRHPGPLAGLWPGLTETALQAEDHSDPRPPAKFATPARSSQIYAGNSLPAP